MTYLSTFNLKLWVQIFKIKKLTQKNYCPNFLLANLTIQITHHSTSQKGHNQIGHVRNDLTKIVEVVFFTNV
jgi:hypothetical protein